MQVISVISTQGDVGKTTIAANPRGFVADAGLRILLLNLDMQPTQPSYYEMISHAPGGIDELLAFNRQDLGKTVPRITINRLDLLLSNDEYRYLYTLLLHAPDGRPRLHNLLLVSVFQPHYDLIAIDAQGVRTVLLELELLMWQQAISPVTPEITTATPATQAGIHILDTGISAIEAFPRAATLCLPAHRVDAYQTRSAREIMCKPATELLPQWHEPFIQVTGKTSGGHAHVNCP
ncbi:ParA family protein [Dickeya dianthicola]|uniref:ParA family protein n=1 Tax=Dickeya dianthicola TaxID=204039 RepID=UPI00136C3523|nr:ParA family protein [Dickeya dianthicola]MCI4234965.1 ParA family protein [Dickeya dianthicola]MCI4239419.1 ParA family protein [Dickeya dianthicola]MCI4256717.1 ParA family protein [Dickeya dianthicola]MZG23896.1 ParA family protein [Dickeya dianthicola]MZI89136.1 ParA family protein [Dickeya dianthicola]